MSMRPNLCPHCGGYHGCPPWKPEPLFAPLPSVLEDRIDKQNNDTRLFHLGYEAGRADTLERMRELLKVLGEELVRRPLPPKQDQPACSLCGGKKTVNWGRSDRVGGEPGPCICTKEGQELIWGKRR